MEFGIQQITIILLVSWFFMFVAAKYQQGRIKKNLFKRIKDGLGPALQKDPYLTLDKFYSWVFENWDDLVRSNAWFVLSKNELYPVLADPQNLRKQMNLTPPWLGAYLRLQGQKLAMTNTQKEAVEAILNALPEKRRQEMLDR